VARKLTRDVRIYEVGGAVRDELLGRPSVDRDWVVVGATPEMMVASGFRPVGNDFPVFLHPDTQEEHALARTERKHGAGYRGFEFFASPDVTLEEDLARRDLTINAIARAPDGTLIDPFGGKSDLERRVLRHVSPAFAEDPLRVLRVARFAARFGFEVAPETATLMRVIVDSGELVTLSPERVWRELATGLMEATPSRMLSVLRECGALAVLMPEVDALFGVAASPASIDAGAHVAMALDCAARKQRELPVRYAVLAQDLGMASPAVGTPRRSGHERTAVRLANGLSVRLRVPVECRDAAHLAARFHRSVHHVTELRPSRLLDIIVACDAMRRPQRLAWLAHAAEADACSLPGAVDDYPQAAVLFAALDVVRAVDAGALARQTIALHDAQREEGSDAEAGKADAIRFAVRRARLGALARWKRERRNARSPRDIAPSSDAR
jgi:tRNA nucleotidyltransferase (CCA-adding enzyme)